MQRPALKPSFLSIPEAATFLNVSQATVRNWRKAGLLPENLSVREVQNLHTSISDGAVLRLNKRANKSKSTKMFIPVECAGSAETARQIELIVALLKNESNDVRDAMYAAVHGLLSSKGELKAAQKFRRSVFGSILKKYNGGFRISQSFAEKLTRHFSEIKNEKQVDLLGLIYQSYIHEGEKSKNGSYYTPTFVVDELIDGLDKKINTFLDPCCGTGSFLISAARRKKIKAENLFGFDTDEHAVFLAKINILLHFNACNIEPKIFCLDSLRLTDAKSFFQSIGIKKVDAITTNPPWGACKNGDFPEELEELTGSKEIFSMFIARSLEFVRDKGECAFLLPESVLNIQSHKGIRGLISTETTIHQIKEHGRIFTGVFTPVISIHFKKEVPKKDNQIKIVIEEKDEKIAQSRFQNAKDHLFDIKVHSETDERIRKIYSIPHQTLKGNARWALGIVTGNNEAHLQANRLKSNEPIYKGSDVEYYRLKGPSNFINYNRDAFQQVAKDEFYRCEEKLIYKFISNKLVFAYDDKKSLTLNSANILIPEIPGMHIKVVLAFLNSSVFQFLFEKKFSTHKVLRSDLEELPFPIVSMKDQAKIISLVDRAINGQAVREMIDKMIVSFFD